MFDYPPPDRVVLLDLNDPPKVFDRNAGRLENSARLVLIGRGRGALRCWVVTGDSTAKWSWWLSSKALRWRSRSGESWTTSYEERS